MVIDLADIMCLTCGQSPVEGAPRHVGEWNDAGHTDGAHEPNWSQESFPGSEWDAHPNGALWYGEVIAEPSDGSDTDYFYGYADSEDAPDVALLLPDGWRMLESTVRATPRNPEWVPADSD